MIPIEEAIAMAFHEVYEAKAPEFGYETRKESAVPWKDVPENQRKLMIAVVSHLLAMGIISREGPSAWEHLASSMRPYTELTFVTLLAMEAGELSEGRAVEMLKVNHLDLREIRHDLITSVVQFSGECKSPLTLLLGILKEKPDSSEKRQTDQQSSNSSGTDD